ncbi:MAG TPA: Wzz/FepE/Etk N-terminal domain-containing protein [Planctomycetota bacterium]|nr:Wzz/FepE/Etk N-terminal domain-containing protein [Planctomycetota bacterium]
MAVQPQSQGLGQLQELLAILKKRAWQIALPAVVVLACGISLAVLLPKEYKVQTIIEVRDAPLPIAGQGVSPDLLQQEVAVARIQIRARERVRRVIERLEWPDYLALPSQMQDLYLERVTAAINVIPVTAQNRGSSFLTIEYTGRDAQRATDFVNTLRQTYTNEVLERFRNTARSAQQALGQQLTQTELRLRDVERASTELKKEHGLSATQQAPGPGRQRDEDPLFTQLTQQEGSLYTARTKLAAEKQALELLEDQWRDTPTEVPQSSAVAGVQVNDALAMLETQILQEREKQVGITPLHSSWKKAELEIERLERLKIGLLGTARPGGTEERFVRNPERDQLQSQVQAKEVSIRELEATIASLETSLEDLRRRHVERTEILREVAELDRQVQVEGAAYDTTFQRWVGQKQFVDVISRPETNPFELMADARPPLFPTSPNVLILIGAALAIGLGVGLAGALAAEFGRNAFRGVGDVSRSLAVPVLGAINRIVTRGEARSALLQRAVGGTSTLVLVGTILWVTWAYQTRPALLGPRVTQLIDDLRGEPRNDLGPALVKEMTPAQPR